MQKHEEPNTPKEAADQTTPYICFGYAHSQKTVLIQGTHGIPEFSSLSILGSFLMVALMALMFRRRRKQSL